MKYVSNLKWMKFVALIVLLGCSCDKSTDPDGVSECSAISSITVTTTPELSFTWEPECALMGWIIEPSGAGTDQWLVFSEGSNSIVPPITYGVVPSGATEIHAAETLVPGTTYDIYLFKWIGPGAQDGIIIDSTSFTM